MCPTTWPAFTQSVILTAGVPHTDVLTADRQMLFAKKPLDCVDDLSGEHAQVDQHVAQDPPGAFRPPPCSGYPVAPDSTNMAGLPRSAVTPNAERTGGLAGSFIFRAAMIGML